MSNMANHKGLSKRALKWIRTAGDGHLVQRRGPGHDPRLAMMYAPCYGCARTVCLAPQRTTERLGFRCFYCFGLFCVKCGSKHFKSRATKRKPQTTKGFILKKLQFRSPWKDVKESLVRVEKMLKRLTKSKHR